MDYWNKNRILRRRLDELAKTIFRDKNLRKALDMEFVDTWGDIKQQILEYFRDNGPQARSFASFLVDESCVNKGHNAVKACRIPSKDYSLQQFKENFASSYKRYIDNLAAAALEESKKPKNQVILENHRKGRRIHPVAKNNWWYEA